MVIVNKTKDSALYSTRNFMWFYFYLHSISQGNSAFRWIKFLLTFTFTIYQMRSVGQWQILSNDLKSRLAHSDIFAEIIS